MTRRVEHLYPYLFAFIVLAIWIKFDLALPDSPSLLAPSVTIGSIITGFMATSKSMLMSLNRPVMTTLRKTGLIDDLASYLVQTILLSFFFVVVSIVGYFGAIEKAEIYGIAWVSMGSAAAFSFLRVVLLMAQILKAADPEETA